MTKQSDRKTGNIRSERSRTMSLFMKRGAGGTSLYPPRIACYVCGAEVPADYPLFPEPSPASPPPPTLASAAAIMSKPHFPFLMHHPPPMGCRPPSPGGVAKSCSVCYSSLMRQWDDYEKTGVPTDKRLYWLKRIDGLSFASPEVQAQAAAEVRARVLGLFHQHPRSPHLRTSSSPASSMAAPSLLHHAHGHHHMGGGMDHSLTSSDRVKSSSPLTVATGNSSLSPMVTPNSHVGTAASSVASSWLSRSAMVSGEVRLSARHSPLLPPMSIGLLEQSHLKASICSTSPRTQPTSKPESLVTVPTTHDNESALDLSSGTRDRETKSISSVVSTGGASHHSSYQSDQSTSVVTDVFDLTLPDKNASFEVCYVCGDEFKRGALSYIFAKQVSSPKEPFYPSLMSHPRPPRSRPMDSAGRVQTCDECFDHLLNQWNQFEEDDDTPHPDRNYTLRKRQMPTVDTTTFVCYICALDYHSSSLRLLYSRPNSEQEPYYPFIEQQKPPPSASPISPQGMVQVCTLCCKSTKEKHHGFVKAEQQPPKKRPKFSSPRDQVDSFGLDSAGDPEDKQNQLPADLICPLCRRKFSVGSFKLLHSQPPPAGGLPYFPFLTDLPKPEDSVDAEAEKQGRVRACRACTTSLLNQWTTYQRDNVAIDDRNYLYQSLLGPRSSQNTSARPQTPSSSRSHKTRRSDRSPSSKVEDGRGGIGVGSRPRSNSNPYGSDRHHFPPVRTPSIASESHPETNQHPANLAHCLGGRVAAVQHQQCHSPSCQSANSGNSNEQLPSGSKCKDGENKSSSSFHCFLCGLHSELTFSRVLYSSAPGKKAPYFPFMNNHVPKQRAETLREDGTALVCTFCYHSVMFQWSRYQDARSFPSPVDPSNRVYNLIDYICYVCGVTTYRKRIRALRVMDFPFLRQHKSKKGITMENGEMVAVCLDCFERLRGQFSDGAKYGIPVDKRQYNWIQIPPPPATDDLIQGRPVSASSVPVAATTATAKTTFTSSAATASVSNMTSK